MQLPNLQKLLGAISFVVASLVLFVRYLTLLRSRAILPDEESYILTTVGIGMEFLNFRRLEHNPK
jgi:hypothetical protein